MDNISIALTKDASYRIYAAVTTETVRRAQKLHNSFPVATAALGRALTAAAMMGAMLKNDRGSITIQIKGGGPLGTVIAVGDAHGTVRGYCANPDVILPPRPDGKPDVGGGVGRNGFINVVRDSGEGQPYSGSVRLVSGEIAEDLTSYFASSEQIPTAIGLGVLVGANGIPDAAGGFIVQLMPGTGLSDEENTARIEQALKEMPPVSSMVSQGNTADDIIDRLLCGMEYDIIDRRSVCYKCNCSRQRVERALALIGEKDLRALIEGKGETEVNCSFCDKKYTFTHEMLESILKNYKF